METRLLLAFLLMGLVLFLTPYIYKAPPAPPKQSPPAAESKLIPAEKKPEAPRSSDRGRLCSRAGADPGHGRTAFHGRHRYLPHHLLQSRRGGAQLGAQEIPRPGGQTARIGEPSQSFAKSRRLSHSRSRTSRPRTSLNYGLYIAKPAADGLGIQYEFSDGKNYAKKTFQFTKRWLSFASRHGSDA